MTLLLPAEMWVTIGTIIAISSLIISVVAEDGTGEMIARLLKTLVLFLFMAIFVHGFLFMFAEGCTLGL